jgi:hypothetical protein
LLPGCDGSPLGGPARYRLNARATDYRIQGQPMAALIAIAVFIAAIFVLNVVDFGRVD